jgi:hypothetical protein
MGKKWDQILGNGVVDHGMPPRPCVTRGSHPLAAARTGSVGARTVLRGLDF